MTEPLTPDMALARLRRPNVGWIDGGKWAPVILGHIDALATELRELREHYQAVGCGQGCQCDPPGSGEEWCVGTCLLWERNKELEAVLTELAPLRGDTGEDS